MPRTVCAVVAVLLAFGCDTGEPAPAAPVTTTTARPAETTEPSRPQWCNHYDAWKRASDEIDSIGRRYGSEIAEWPPGVLDEFFAANEAQSRAAGVLWDGTEAGAVPRGWDARARACR